MQYRFNYLSGLKYLLAGTVSRLIPYSISQITLHLMSPTTCILCLEMFASSTLIIRFGSQKPNSCPIWITVLQAQDQMCRLKWMILRGGLLSSFPFPWKWRKLASCIFFLLWGKKSCSSAMTVGQLDITEFLKQSICCSGLLVFHVRIDIKAKVSSCHMFPWQIANCQPIRLLYSIPSLQGIYFYYWQGPGCHFGDSL